jgi:cytochrome c oxidase subunit 3
MSEKGKTPITTDEEPKPGFFRGARFARENPYPLMLILALVGSSMLFLFLLIMLISRKYTVGIQPMRLPMVFWLSTMLIGMSSGALWLAIDYFKKEQYRQYLNWLGITAMLGLTFLFSQTLGGLQLFLTGKTIADSPALAFLVIIAGLHFAHIVVAIGFLGWTLLDASRNRSYVDGFIQSLNPAKQTRLHLVTIFWHFLDALWIVLFACFVLFLSA